jgi:hypothetical protein
VTTAVPAEPLNYESARRRLAAIMDEIQALTAELQDETRRRLLRLDREGGGDDAGIDESGERPNGRDAPP